MLHSSTKKLIDRLAEMTELGKLDWTEGDDGNVIYSTEGYSVRLPASADEVLITSIEGKELERAASADLAVSHTDDGISYADIVATMTKEATRIALGTETAISTLLAGMEEPAIPEPEPEVAVEEPEDVVNETTALAEEETAVSEPEAPTEVATEAPEVDAEADQDEEAKAEAESTDEVAIEEISTDSGEETSAPLATFEPEEESASQEEESSDPVAAFAIVDNDERETDETSSDASDTSDAVAHDIAPTESESELTEAVARLADEVNGREEEESDIGAAAASAVGAVALAAGLTGDSEETIEPEAETSPEQPVEVEASEPEAAEIAAAPAATTSSVTYVPFGTEEVEEEPAPVAIETESEIAAPEDTVAAEPEAVTVEDEPVEVEAEPETAEIVTPSFVSVAASLEKEEPAETSSFETFSAEPASDPAPMEAAAAAAETLETPDPVEEEAPEVALTPETGAEEEEPQSYSLSGIGAGFGLGALAAKTEASGIPGPSDLGSEQEKIIIDATDDVLPEPEGQSSFSTLPSSGNGISFGNAETPESVAETEGESEEDTDILKPRTRFNPWD